MDNLLTFNLRVPVGLQVVSHLISENTILEQLLLTLSSVINGCKFEDYRKDIEVFSHGPLQSANSLQVQHALAIYAKGIADKMLADFVPEMTQLLGLAPGPQLPQPTPPAEPPAEPPAQPPTQSPEEAETKKKLTSFAEKNFSGFPQFSPDRIEQITNQAATNIQSIAEKSKIPPEEIPKAAQLAFYDFVVLYDDSGSMTTEPSRISTTKETIEGLYKASKVLNPANPFSIRSFEGPQWENVSAESDLTDILSKLAFNTGASVAAPDRKSVV